MHHVNVVVDHKKSCIFLCKNKNFILKKYNNLHQ